MGSFFEGTKEDVVTTQEQSSQLNAFGGLQPGLNEASSQLNAAIRKGPFTGSFLGDQSDFTNQFQNIAGGNVGQTNPFFQQAQGTLSNGLNFTNPELDALRQFGPTSVNPFLNQQFEAAAQPFNQAFAEQGAGLAGRFSNLGRLRGAGAGVGEVFGRQEDARARGLGQLSANIFAPGFENAQNRSLQAAQSLGQFGAQGEQLRQAAVGQGVNAASQQFLQQQGLLGNLLNAGTIGDARNQAEVDNQFQQFNNPFNFASQSLSALGPTAAQFGTQEGSGSQTKPVFGPSPFSQVAGVGLGIAGLAVGGPAGASAGSLGGNFLGGLVGGA